MVHHKIIYNINEKLNFDMKCFINSTHNTEDRRIQQIIGRAK